ncbi:MAG: PrsW family intramembrane metalloprotease [Stigonema ocellatum SAG 48.90 = DSM 106950]|nr:PrsW family intramembrane metalloprotease [Stigonema ocellatum SAG 48.90 = DSM 106950]
MTEPNFLELTNIGDSQAIASLMNRSLQPRGVTVEASFKDTCLHIWLKSNRVLNQQALVAFVRKVMMSLETESIITVRVYAQQTGESFPDWTEEFILTDIQPVEPAIPNFETPRKQGNLMPVSTAAKQQLKNSEFFTALRTFKFSSVVPYKDALSSELYSSNTVRLLLFFGLFPLAVRFIITTAGLEQIAWILGIYYSSIWGVVLYDLLKPTEFSWSNTLKCVLFTTFVGIPLLLFVQKVPPFSLLYTVTNEVGLTSRILGFVLGVGILEESCKALPVYLFLLRPGKLKDPLTSAFYGAMSGLGFAMAEGVGYSRMYALILAAGQSDFGSYILSNTIRFVSLPLLHAIWAGIVGYFLGLAAINPSRSGSIIFIGVAISAVLHGCYDTFAGDLLGFAILTFSILLFVAYLRRSKQMVDEMQQAELGYKTLRRF